MNDTQIEHMDEKQYADQTSLISWLDTIIRDFDQILLEARKKSTVHGWFGSWLLHSLLGLTYKEPTKGSISKINSFFSHHWTLWSAILIGVFGPIANHWTISTFQPWPRNITIAWLIFSVIMSCRSNFTRMLTIGDPYFTPDAYRIFRPVEYQMIKSYINENKHTFGSIQKWVNYLYKENSLESIIRIQEANTKKLEAEVNELKKKSYDEELRQKTESYTGNDNEGNDDEYIEIIENLFQQIEYNQKGYNKAIDIIMRLRMRKPALFGLNDLRIISGFSLFELCGDSDLYMIAEQDTTETPVHINVDDPQFEHYSSVKLVKGTETIEYASSDREGREVSSYWLNSMLSNRIFIYNIHFDSSNETIYDIIESKEMYRLIRSIIVHLEERALLKRAGEEHENA